MGFLPSIIDILVQFKCGMAQCINVINSIKECDILRMLQKLVDDSPNVEIANRRKKYFYICAKAFIEEGHTKWIDFNENLTFDKNNHIWRKPIYNKYGQIVKWRRITRNLAKKLCILNYWNMTQSQPGLIKHYQPNKFIDTFDKEKDFHFKVNNPLAHLKGCFIRVK